MDKIIKLLMNMGKTKEEAIEFVGKDVPKGGIDDVSKNILKPLTKKVAGDYPLIGSRITDPTSVKNFDFKSISESIADQEANWKKTFEFLREGGYNLSNLQKQNLNYNLGILQRSKNTAKDLQKTINEQKTAPSNVYDLEKNLLDPNEPIIGGTQIKRDYDDALFNQKAKKEIEKNVNKQKEDLKKIDEIENLSSDLKVLSGKDAENVLNKLLKKSEELNKKTDQETGKNITQLKEGQTIKLDELPIRLIKNFDTDFRLNDLTNEGYTKEQAEVLIKAKNILKAGEETNPNEALLRVKEEMADQQGIDVDEVDFDFQLENPEPIDDFAKGGRVNFRRGSRYSQSRSPGHPSNRGKKSFSQSNSPGHPSNRGKQPSNTSKFSQKNSPGHPSNRVNYGGSQYTASKPKPKPKTKTVTTGGRSPFTYTKPKTKTVTTRGRSPFTYTQPKSKTNTTAYGIDKTVLSSLLNKIYTPTFKEKTSNLFKNINFFTPAGAGELSEDEKNIQRALNKKSYGDTVKEVLSSGENKTAGGITDVIPDLTDPKVMSNIAIKSGLPTEKKKFKLKGDILRTKLDYPTSDAAYTIRSIQKFKRPDDPTLKLTAPEIIEYAGEDGKYKGLGTKEVQSIYDMVSLPGQNRSMVAKGGIISLRNKK